MTADLTNLRAEFRENGLNRSELDNDPFKQFSLWFSQAIKSGIVEQRFLVMSKKLQRLNQ